MRCLTTLFALLLLIVPATAVTAIGADGLPANSTWYLHADFAAMKDSKAGKALYEWIDNEIFSEVRSEAGIDLRRELDSVTSYSVPDDGAVMVLQGRISETTRDKLLAISAAAERFETLESNGKTYYFVEGDADHANEHTEISGFDGEIYFSFDVRNKLLLTAKREQMETLLANGGRLRTTRDHDGARASADGGAMIEVLRIENLALVESVELEFGPGLNVLTGEKSLIQAGMDTDGFDTDGEGFQSNILRNTKQVALMIADAADKLSFEALLIATEPKTAQSLGSVIRGLIALVAFDEDMDPGMAEVIQSARVDVDDVSLKLSIAVSPESFTAALD